MLVPHSATDDIGPVSVLMPLRSLHDGKLRLSTALAVEERAELIESMASAVIQAAHELDVLVVHEDPRVAPWARERGAQVFRPTKPGLNRAVAQGRDYLFTLGYGRVIIAHADLPHARDLRVVLSDVHTIAIAPDRHHDGTNVMCLPTDIDFTFAYGPGSFDAHCHIARDLGLEPHIVDAPDLAWDVDHPDDLSPRDLPRENK